MTSTRTVRAPLRERLAYSTGDLAFNLIYVATGTYLMYFYTDVAGISATVVGTIFLVARLLDGVWDMAIGILMEKWHSRHGKTRAWLLYLAIPYGIAATLLFTAPNLGENGKIVYAFATYLLSAVVIYTAMNIPYGALSALMTDDPADRGRLSTLRMVGAYSGTLIVAALTLPLVDAFGGGKGAWTMTFGLYAVLAVVLFFVVFAFTHERVGERASAPDADRTFSTSTALRSLLRNKYWVIMTVYGALILTAYGLESIYTYYAQEVLHDTNLATTLFTFRTIAEFAGVFLAMPLLKVLSKRDISLAGCVAIVIGQVILVLGGDSRAVVYVGLGVAGLGLGAMFAMLFGMIGDTSEYETWRSGIRAEGLIFAGATIGSKVGSALGGVIVGWMLGLGGYVSGGGKGVVQPPGVLSDIRFIFVWMPMGFAVVMAALLLFYRLDKEYPAILADLRARSEAAVPEPAPPAL